MDTREIVKMLVHLSNTEIFCHNEIICPEVLVLYPSIQKRGQFLKASIIIGNVYFN